MKGLLIFISLLVYYTCQCFDQPNSVKLEKLNNRERRSEPNKSNPGECQTPSGERGHCRLSSQCPLPELRQNTLKMLDYLCIIGQSSIGVCCPDNQAESLPQQGNTNDVIMGKQSIDMSNKIRPENRGCGLSTKSYSRITGGRPADPNEWPWMAAIIRRGQPNMVSCGGVLITDVHILTASHCVFKYDKSELTVRLGEYDIAIKNETRARDFRVAEIRSHIDFDEFTYDNDIAILKLNQKVLFNSYIWPVCMPPPGESFEGYIGIVTGWGTQFFGGPSSNVLMEVSIPILNSDDCQNSFVERIGENVLCAGTKEGGRDSCQGDSGGPLLVQLPNKRWVTVGIVSYGIRCGEKYPGVYTRVNKFSNWIIENAIF
ncbi:venom serine protease Bi-VSP [Contarinia nasturtii]|uniref:venom serine protease Bi-VSP n=1 Tax=Contarinia nasturtii TaxID=265458 RepID=UPI0012D4918E|nr:venom serine protease Bi-VSP [Contarinia nasturtii]